MIKKGLFDNREKRFLFRGGQGKELWFVPAGESRAGEPGKENVCVLRESCRHGSGCPLLVNSIRKRLQFTREPSSFGPAPDLVWVTRRKPAVCARMKFLDYAFGRSGIAAAPSQHMGHPIQPSRQRTTIIISRSFNNVPYFERELTDFCLHC